ncbi:MBL fold metallo-hydrolase [Archaeoglobus sp.]
MKIKILYDNKALPGFKPGWGFSALLCLGLKSVLFDTGSDAGRLDFNARMLGVDKSDIRVCFISHKHADHTGGLGWLQSGTKIFFPGEYDGSLAEIDTLFFSRPIKEQALIYKPQRIMFVGCSHPGIILMAREAFERYGKLELIVGGMHLFGITDYKIESIAKELKKFTKRIAPCHCTGDEGRKIFRDVFGERFVEAKAGSVIVLNFLG